MYRKFQGMKLSRENFARKYWRGGREPYVYQYHSLEIEDARDEREQLVFNNQRALYNMNTDNGKKIESLNTEIRELKNTTSKIKSILLVVIAILLFERGKKR